MIATLSHKITVLDINASASDAISIAHTDFVRIHEAYEKLRSRPPRPHWSAIALCATLLCATPAGPAWAACNAFPERAFRTAPRSVRQTGRSRHLVTSSRSPSTQTGATSP